MERKYYLIALIAILLLSYSCSHKTKTVTRTTSSNQGDEYEPYQHPKEDGWPELPTAEILGTQFKVSEQTKVEFYETHTIVIVRNGVQYDSTWTTHHLRYIDINELGVVKTVVKSKGKVVGLYVTFDSLKNWKECELYFKKRPSDRRFYLTTIDGKETESRWGKKRRVYSTLDCKLLYDPESKDTRTIIKSHATGVKVK
jgi:hypothetical protein